MTGPRPRTTVPWCCGTIAPSSPTPLLPEGQEGTRAPPPVRRRSCRARDGTGDGVIPRPHRGDSQVRSPRRPSRWEVRGGFAPSASPMWTGLGDVLVLGAGRRGPGSGGWTYQARSNQLGACLELDKHGSFIGEVQLPPVDGGGTLSACSNHWSRSGPSTTIVTAGSR